MTSEAFVKLVSDMRHAQKEYFRTRSEHALTISKSLEKQVDAALTRLMHEDQKELF